MKHYASDMIASVQRASRVAQDHPVLGPYLAMLTRLPIYVRLGADMARDPEVPASAKASLVAAGAYAVWPFDLVPGFIPVAGQMDDLAALLLSIKYAIRMTPKEISVPHLERAGITPQQIDDDLRSLRDATFWLAKRAATSVRTFATSNASRVGTAFRKMRSRTEPV